MPRDFRKIKAWQLADTLVMKIYTLTKLFSREELYGLCSQIRRAVISVATNIAEGAGRGHKKEYLNFLYIAKGSLAEVDYLCYLSKQLGYLNQLEYSDTEQLLENTAKTLAGLIKSVAKEVDND
jgi:four helix bundle protein